MRLSFLLSTLLSVSLASSASAQFFGKKSNTVPVVTVTKPGTAAAPDSDVRSSARTTPPRSDAAGAQQPSAGGNNAVFRPGDSIDMRISGIPADEAGTFPSPITISPDGFLNITYIGQIRAAGLGQHELEAAIAKRFVDEKIFRWPTVAINVMNQQRTVTVGGNVRGPGRQPWSADLTLMSSIASAGGLSDFAGDKINLIRGGAVTVYRYKALKKNPADDPRILPGDQVDMQ